MPRARKSPAFQWYPRDYLADPVVQSMTLEQEGAYRRLMDVCWLEHGLPNDPAQLWYLAKAKNRERFTRHIWPVVGRKFQLRKDKLQHKRLDRERAKQAKTRKARTLAAKERWERMHASADANASRLQCLASSSSSATAIKKKELQPRRARPSLRAVEDAENPGSAHGTETDPLPSTLRPSEVDPSGQSSDRRFGVEGTHQKPDGEVGIRGGTVGRRSDQPGDERDRSRSTETGHYPPATTDNAGSDARADAGAGATDAPSAGMGDGRAVAGRAGGFTSIAGIAAAGRK